MDDQTSRKREAGRQALILDRIYSKTTGTHPLQVPAPSTEPLRLPRPRVVRPTQTAIPTRTLPQPSAEAHAHTAYDPFHDIPDWLKVIGIGVLIMLVVAIFGASSQTTHDSDKHVLATPAPQKTTETQKTGRPGEATRIDQNNPNQYASYSDFLTWHPSTCSAASMTEIFNAYASVTGHRYRLADILAVESQIGEITPQDGLLHATGIDRTAAQFGFVAQWLQNPSYEDLISRAKSHPIIINFPPPASGGHWDGGHVLVTTSGTNSVINLVDSSSLSSATRYQLIGHGAGLKHMTRDDFLYYWRGFAVILTPTTQSAGTVPLTWNVLCLPNFVNIRASGPYAVVSKPTISADFISRVLASYNSPAKGLGHALYDAAVSCGIDPAFALAFFLHESTMGKSGEANLTHSLGNLRCIPSVACVNTDGTQCKANQSCYAFFSSWQESFQVWARLIFNLYVVGWGLTIVDTIIPKYAPPGDNNNDDAYIASLKHSINTWSIGQLVVS